MVVSWSSRPQQRAESVIPLERPRIVMIGPPGSGKSSRARELASRLGLRHLSSGDMLREEVRRASPIGVRATDYMHTGALVPDWLIDLLYQRHLTDAVENGFVLDGYPRTVGQAGHLLEVLGDQPPNLLIRFVVPDDVVVERLVGRTQCIRCSVIARGDSTNVCGACGGTLRRRDDDCDRVVRTRLGQYHDLLEPLLDALRGIVFRADIDANRGPDVIEGDLLCLVDPELIQPEAAEL